MSTRLPQILLAAAALTLAATSPAAAQQGDEAFATSPVDETVQWGSCPDFMAPGCDIAVLQGKPAEPNADILFRLQGGEAVPRHTHTSAERMVLLSGEMEVDYDGQAPVVLTSGTYAYGPPGLPHSADCLSAEACVLFIAFEQPIDAMEAEAE